MAPRVKQTARKRTLQIEGHEFPWVQLVLPLVPIPDSDDDEGNSVEIERCLNEPREWNLFLTNKALEVSTEAIREVLGLPKVNNDWKTDVASLPMKEDIWDSIKRVLCNDHKYTNWTLDKHGNPKSFEAKHLKEQHKSWFNFVCTNLLPSNSQQ
ncbi:OLC1v1012753C1 [Oldenlandia corymbosa var. corymbosa]|uniref:OLC1v1012753C1 n=1 Tax=Oldenlandia corymbosa var. corymbosa TaxID=529605 RepID=A0AAV1DWP9_OLDCO|nr:OLC1v1012753C1 [Oldenlandia corymbosa var. corymbosa]